jgi:hypothetical protein
MLFACQCSHRLVDGIEVTARNELLQIDDLRGFDVALFGSSAANVMKVNRARQKPAQNMPANSLVASRASVVTHRVIEARGIIIQFRSTGIVTPIGARPAITASTRESTPAQILIADLNWALGAEDVAAV